MKPRTEYDLDAVGLSPEVMRAAKQAAAAAGIPVHAWLTRAIMANRAPVPSTAAPQIEGPQLTLTGAEKIREALARLAGKEAAPQDEPIKA